MQFEDQIPDLVPVQIEDSERNQSENENKDDDHRETVPITILTGYLGAGKTTLLQYILTQNHGKKIAVIMNEFASTRGIDKAIASADKEGKLVEEWLDLDNGCMCCTVKDRGIKALESLMEKQGKFDYILLETTGVADPGEIASMLWTNEEFGSFIKLDGIVTLVDAQHILDELTDFGKPSGSQQSSVNFDDVSENINEVVKQIAFADRIIVNKVDLVDEHKLQSIKARIEQINATSELYESTFAKINLDIILSINAYSATEKISLSSSFGDRNNKHNPGNVSTCLLTPAIGEDIEWALLEPWIQSLLWENTCIGSTASESSDKDTASGSESVMTILRMKGLLRVKNFCPPCEAQKVPVADIAIQGVRETYDAFAINSSDQLDYKLVFIGKNLDTKRLSDSWNRYVLKKLN